jgi:hypothetical protein
MLFRDLEQICVGELMLTLTEQDRYWIDVLDLHRRAISCQLGGGAPLGIAFRVGEREHRARRQRAGGSATPSGNPCLSEDEV